MATAKYRPFPLDKDHHFGPATISRTSHNGSQPADFDQLVRVQQALGVDQVGVYDVATHDAVLKAQKKAKLPETGLVDEATWKALKIEA